MLKKFEKILNVDKLSLKKGAFNNENLLDDLLDEFLGKFR